jgi:GNAT superfamily N-acetyltransferase
VTADDVAAIERATLAAVPPAVQEEIEGWLIGLDPGTVGRAASAVPLVHAPAAAGIRREIESRYRAHGLAPRFRLAQVAAFDGLREELQAAGYQPRDPTRVQVGLVQDIVGLKAAPVEVTLADEPDEGWAELFLGGGFEPVDAASRLGILRRARHSVFASVRIDGRTCAVGSACFSHGWCGLHAMRTAPAARGRGLASAILVALAREAAQRGFSRAMLQVEAGNETARSLYRRAGFGDAWIYEYWRMA